MTNDLQELAEWIHENIMGECVHEWKWENEPAFPRHYWCKKCGYFIRSLVPGEEEPKLTPPYPTDIAAAWKVLEKIKRFGLRIEITLYESKDLFLVTATKVSERMESVGKQNGCLEMAICDTAKQAHEEGWLG